jgi:hypothetical protein
MSGTGSAQHAQGPVPAVWRSLRILAGAASDAIPLLLWGFIAFSLFYGLTIIYGAVAGYALPTTAIFAVLPHGDVIARGEKYLPGAILLIAMLGASLGWINAAGLSVPRLRQNELAGMRFFFRWGLPVLCVIFILVLSADGWSGRIALGPGEYFSIAGLFPHSDAAAYFLSPFEQALSGSWSDFASRRPFAAGFRHVIVAAAGFSYVWTLLLQSLLVSAALFAAARSIILWRGLWAGFAFIAFVYTLARIYLSTTATEPIGLIWALLSVMFLADAMRFGAPRFAFLALATLTLGEMTRMGSILTIPAFVLWIALAFGTKLRERMKLFAAGCLVVAIALFVQTLCAWLYGNPTTIIGGNFAYTLCGLAVEGDWTTCPKLFAQEFNRLVSERDEIHFLYSRAIGIMLADPLIAAHGMYLNINKLVQGAPEFMVSGYDNPSRFIPPAALGLLLPGIFSAMWRNRARGELLFWILIFASMIASAAIIFRDDGWRTMTVTWPLVALFLALGCKSPRTVRLHHLKPTFSFRSGVLLISTVVALVLLTPAVTRIWPGRELQNLSKLGSSGNAQQAVLYGPMLTGFLVIPDDTSLPKATPALHETDFVNLIQNIGIERDFGRFLDVALEQVPFAFVTAGTITHPNEEQIYLAPTRILSSGPAKAWQVTFGNRLRNTYIHDVVALKSLP